MKADAIVEILRQKKYRMTKSRIRLINLFYTDKSKHLTIEDIIQEEEKFEKVNIATIYNNLELLQKEEIIYEFSIYGKRYYEKFDQENHTHLICRHCQTIVNIATENFVSNKEIISKEGFIPKKQIQTIYGCCQNCCAKKCQDCTAGCQFKVNIVNDEQYIIDEAEIRSYLNYLKNVFKDKKNISIVFVDEAKIAELNHYRDKSTVTDILSFPFEDEDYLGDLIICYKRMREQALEYGHSERRELLFLLTHGYLHLQGYDHIEYEDEVEMFMKQDELLKTYGVER